MKIQFLGVVKRLVGVVVIGLVVIALGRLLLLRPSPDRPWKEEHAIMPEIEFQGSLVHISNIRNFEYHSADDYTPRYDERTYDLDKLESLWFVLSPFMPAWRGPAHSFLSFGFTDSQYVAVSVEARKEQGESYSVLLGMLNKFELIYVIGDERDLIGLRAVYWDDPVFVYPVNAGKVMIRELFVDMLKRVNRLRAKPEFYNTITSNCTTNLYEHAEHVNPEAAAASWQLLLPGYMDERLLSRGVLHTDLPIEDARAKFQVNERAQQHIDQQHFSLAIREIEEGNKGL